jgi:glucuronate isomerase
MVPKTLLHEDLMFPPEPTQRSLARRFYGAVRDLPIISPHGHTDPKWFALNKPFPDPAALFIVPDHYVFRMLYSQGVPLESLGIPRTDGGPVERDPRKIWRLFARYFYLFRATPTRLWFLHSLQEVFGVTKSFTPETADEIYDRIARLLATPDFLPRTLFEKFNIEVLATSDSPADPLTYHRSLRETGWEGRIIPTYRPDPVVDPEFPGFAENVQELGAIAGEDTTNWRGYLRALEARRRYFKELGAKATDHGHATACTCDNTESRCQVLLDRSLSGRTSAAEAEEFRGQMLTEMARMSIDDGLVMQVHPGSYRNHNPSLFHEFGIDKGADIPTRTDFVRGLKPLLDRFGNDPRLSVILFTLDESTYSRELAPLAGHYPAVKLGPAWWFYDSPEGMRFYRERVTETAGFYNTVGFNDDTRAFLSIPARHDIARRADCAYLARLVAEHRLEEAEATEIAIDLAYRLARDAYRLQKPDEATLNEPR